MHKGKRTDLVRVACLCETGTARVEDMEEEILSCTPKSQKTQQKTRVGNMEALGPTGQGIKNSYERKLKLISKCYRDKPVQPAGVCSNSERQGGRPRARGRQLC